MPQGREQVTSRVILSARAATTGWCRLKTFCGLVLWHQAHHRGQRGWRDKLGSMFSFLLFRLVVLLA